MIESTGRPFIIEPGDTVDVHFESINSIHGAIVISRPRATGDAWVLEELGGFPLAPASRIHYVQQYSLMTLVKKATN